jgi:hypothetical protein
MSEEDNRRNAQRQDAIVLVEVTSEEKAGRVGVTRNASDRGLLIATRTRFKVDDRLELTVHGKQGPLRVNARVVRVSESPPKESWRYAVAVHLDEPLPEEYLREGASAAAKLLSSGSKPPSA